MIKSKILQIAHRTPHHWCWFGYGLIHEMRWEENIGWDYGDLLIQYKSYEFEESLQKFAKLIGL